MPIIISTLLILGSLPPFGIPFIGLFFLIPLLLKRHGSNTALVAQDGFLFALIISAYIFFGTWSYNIYAYLAITLLFTFAFTFFLYIAFIIISVNKYAVLIIPLLWLFIELVFEFFNLPITFSFLFTPTPSLLLPAQYGGQHLLSMLLISFQVIVVVTYNRVETGQFFCQSSYFISLMLPAIMLIVFSLPEIKPLEMKALDVSIVQTNAHPRNTLALAADDMIESLIQHRQDLLARVYSTRSTPELIVWPEVSLAKYEFRNSNNISATAALSDVNMLVASPDISPSGKSYNSVFSISSSGTVLDRYTKNILIPFLEDGPVNKPSWLPHNKLPGSPGSIICYESIFSRPSVKLAASGAGFITLSTNDAYAGPSILPYLHLQFSRIRAVETGKTFIRAANGGPSAVITADGRIHNSLGLFTSGVIQTSVKPNYGLSFFVRHYDSILIAYWTLSFIAVIGLLIILGPHLRNPQFKQSLSLKHTLLATSVLSICLAFQYFYISHIYQTNSGKKLPETFVNFQREHTNDIFNYSQLKANTSRDSLLSAITYLLRDYGNNISLSKINREFFNAHDRKYDIDIDKIISRYQYTTLRKTFSHLHLLTEYSIPTPCLALLSSGETVVISDFTDRHVVFFSPYFGNILAVKTEAFLDQWTGKVITIIVKEKPWDT